MGVHHDDHFDNLYRDLINSIERGVSPRDSLDQLARQQAQLFGAYPALLQTRLEALERARLHLEQQLNRVTYLQKRALRFGREHWYLGPSREGALWDTLQARLRALGRTEDEVSSVDTDSSIVLGLADNPSRPRFSTRGLVVGHVQSGKTGNMAAVIQKAADTQYKFFLVMSGLTDQLRHQTQTRLESDVVGLAPDRWMLWTAKNTDGENGDFAERASGGFSFDHRNQLAVVKKNAGVLRRFLAKLKNTDRATLANTPFLVIDDECDQASVNSARYERAVTRINELIRKILEQLPRVAYVGYTATPFANVLIDATSPQDLYPRHFIHALARPKSYFGAQELFGRHALEGEYDERADGLDMIRTVPDADAEQLRPPRRSAAVPEVAESLRRAIRYFVMVVAARRVRSGTRAHNTMLVHTSVLNSVHWQTAAVVRPYVEAMREGLARSEPALLASMSREWTAEQERVLSEQFDQSQVEFDHLRGQLDDAVSSLQVHVENWTADSRLDYSGEPKTYLVIGGNVLARGLTLEGLSVSYFLRSSNQYDTLMQMGRWFGFRTGFEDLPRVWVEDRVRQAFFDLATVEAEVRRDIARYAEEELTPEQFAVRIRKIPGMAITAPAKMRHATPVSIGYSGTHVQTFRFQRDNLSVLRDNWRVASELLDATPAPEDSAATTKICRGVGAATVATFLRRYQAHRTHRNLAPQFLATFVAESAKQNPSLDRWTVVVMAGQGGLSAEPLGKLGKVHTVVRSAEANSGEDASIKALMSRQDVVVDMQRSAPVPTDASWDDLKAFRERHNAGPLLLLYPINALSSPSRHRPKAENPREPLNAAHDVLGFGIVFTGDRQLSGTYVSANIAPDTGDPEDEMSATDQIPESLLESTGDGGER